MDQKTEETNRERTRLRLGGRSASESEPREVGSLTYGASDNAQRCFTTHLLMCTYQKDAANGRSQSLVEIKKQGLAQWHTATIFVDLIQDLIFDRPAFVAGALTTG